MSYPDTPAIRLQVSLISDPSDERVARKLATAEGDTTMVNVSVSAIMPVAESVAV